MASSNAWEICLNWQIPEETSSNSQSNSIFLLAGAGDEYGLFSAAALLDLRRETASLPSQDEKPLHSLCSDTLVGPSKALLLDLGVPLELAAGVTLFLWQGVRGVVLLFLVELVAQLLLMDSAGKVTIKCARVWQDFCVFWHTVPKAVFAVLLIL